MPVSIQDYEEQLNSAIDFFVAGIKSNAKDIKEAEPFVKEFLSFKKLLIEGYSSAYKVYEIKSKIAGSECLSDALIYHENILNHLVKINSLIKSDATEEEIGRAFGSLFKNCQPPMNASDNLLAISASVGGALLGLPFGFVLGGFAAFYSYLLLFGPFYPLFNNFDSFIDVGCYYTLTLSACAAIYASYKGAELAYKEVKSYLAENAIGNKTDSTFHYSLARFFKGEKQESKAHEAEQIRITSLSCVV